MRKFSVCIPTHRLDTKFYTAVSSVLSQDYPRELFEICVFKNGNLPVATAKELRADKLSQVSTPWGPSEAKNSALDMASTEYAILLDGDDMLIPSALKTYDKILEENPDLELGCEFSSINILKSPDQIGVFFHRDALEFCDFFSINIGKVESTGAVGRPIIFKKKGRIPFDPDFSFAEERKLATDYWAAKRHVHIMKSCTYVYNWNEAGITKGLAVGESAEFKQVTEDIAAVARSLKPLFVVTDPLYLVPPKEHQELARWTMLEKFFSRRIP